MGFTLNVSHHLFPADLSDRLSLSAVIAVVVVDDAGSAIPLARALLDGGVKAIELTLRTDAALDALASMASQFPELTVGAGTVLSEQQVEQVHEAGAAFAVAPGLNPSTIAAAKKCRLPFAPGICTPSEIEIAVESGCRLLKFFPAEPSGGISYLKSIHGPYAHLGLQYIPLGGIDDTNAGGYLQSEIVHSIGGSWIAPQALIRNQDWSSITRRAQRMVEIATASREA